MRNKNHLLLYHPHLPSPHQGNLTATIVLRSGLQCGHLTGVITMVVLGTSTPGTTTPPLLTFANLLAANQEILSQKKNRAVSIVFLQYRG